MCTESMLSTHVALDRKSGLRLCNVLLLTHRCELVLVGIRQRFSVDLKLKDCSTSFQLV